MALYVLDTSIASIFTRGNDVLKSHIQVHAGKDDIALAVITLEETFGGWLAKVRKSKKPEDIASAYEGLSKSLMSLSPFPIINYDLHSIIKYNQLNKLKLNIGGNDLRIAAIALVHNATVVTQNLRDFTRVPGLSVVDWTV